MADHSELTRLERFLDRFANRYLGRVPAGVQEFLAFGIKQAWACLFGALMLAAIIATAWFYPADAGLARNDLLVILAVIIQIGMLALRLETGREVIVIIVFHLVGTGMELFKTAVGSWNYAPGGVLHIGAVPLFTGFMYAAVGSYLVRVYRLFDLRFTHYPPRWLTVIIAAAIYLNFFTHHFVLDARYVLVAAVGIVFLRCRMHFHVHRRTLRMPVLLAFVLVAFFIWIAENIGTATGAWLYPSQTESWHLVPLTKLVAWFLLMMISVVLVTLVYPPKRPTDADAS
ncbi:MULTISPECIES: DUF817 domain-containing protein [unclassified Brevibacterium]|uniref:DUF817 domain-containing protein n=1 Tax=unclassified Brevibacterium TaxID=2614124 RepID=UPI001E4AE8EB|nr:MULTISPECIES: DUF817 domain-containing protein [unclassified Brevibacterium]MCD1285087.1 DUF817 domain-containing protein [Brevibacterium sp. CCUG 69071]MDK8435290.1 DUF817 domain-containing protein [Brevibacterium sp. H-BE7]